MQVGQLDLANASLVAAAGGNPISPSMLAAQGKLALGPHEVPPSMTQPRLLIEQQMQRGSIPTTSGGQSNEEMTATEEERLRHASVAPAHTAAAHSFGSSGETAFCWLSVLRMWVLRQSLQCSVTDCCCAWPGFMGGTHFVVPSPAGFLMYCAWCLQRAALGGIRLCASFWPSVGCVSC